MGKNRKAALELAATTPSHVPGANYAPARSPVNRMTTARMSAPHTAEERESSSSASADDGDYQEPLPPAVPTSYQFLSHACPLYKEAETDIVEDRVLLCLRKLLTWKQYP